MREKQDWQCVTPGCGRAKYQGDWCPGCARKNTPRPLVVRTRKIEPPRTWPTGETRRAEGQSQAEMTDGRQRWWVSAMEVAA